MSKFYKFVKAEAGSELILEGAIASESWYDDEVSPKMFREELEKHPGDITVRINSPGGDVWAGLSIFNMLKEHSGNVTVKVDGLAASAASFIAMAGDKITMLPGAMMMVHNASSFAFGNKKDLESTIEMLRACDESMVGIYASRTGQTEDKIRELLEAETWMTAQEAVELGFADEAVGAKTSLAEAMAKISEVTSSMKSAVTAPVMSIQARKVEPSATDTTENSAEVVAEESETPGAEATEVEEEATAETETKVEATEEVETAEEVAEPPVEEVKAVKEKEIKAMSKQNDIATEGVQAALPKQDAKPTVDAKAWFKSKDAVEAFTMALANNAGKDFRSEEVQAAYKDAQVKAGIADPSIFTLPEPVVTSIEDAVKSGEIYSRMNHTGLDVFKLVWDDTDANADTSRAGGFNPLYESEAVIDRTKEEQVLDFEKRVIRAQYIYKYLVLGKETVRENRSTGALVRFVLNELPVRIIRELERAAIIGDGRGAGSKRKITSFVSVKADSASNVFATSYTPQSGESLAEAVRRARDLIEADGEVVLIAKKGFATDATFEKDGDGKLLFPIGTSAEAILGVNTIIEPTWFNDTTDPDNDAYLVVLSKYLTVGDNSVEAFTNFKLETNENEFLQEIYKGGALAAVNAAVAIAVGS